MLPPSNFEQFDSIIVLFPFVDAPKRSLRQRWSSQ
jgi:hypothetical protein